MIYKIDRLGSETNNEGLFLINDSVQVKYVYDKDGELMMDLSFDDDTITEQEAQELGEELLREVITSVKVNL